MSTARFTYSHSAVAPGIGKANASLPLTAVQVLELTRQARDKGQRDIIITDTTTGKRFNLADFEALCEDGVFDAEGT